MIVARVRRTIRERALLAGGERVLVACSGGPDSAALLHALARLAPELSIELCAASVDHGLRPEAAREVEIAAALARRLEVPFTALRVEVGRDGPSVQAQARRARYDALFAEARRVGASALAVGHTLDDQAETVLSRLLRGAGVLGLSGIEPKREDGVIRPLIDCSRADVHAHVRHHALEFARDPSNEDPRFERARLRRTVVPALLAEDPRAIEHLARIADDARALRALLADAADELLAACADGERALDARRLGEAPAPVRAEALARWVQRLTGMVASRAHRVSLERTLRGSGETLLPDGVRVRREGGALVARRDPSLRTRSRRTIDPGAEDGE